MNQLILFRFGNIQLLDLMNFLGGTKSLDSFLKPYITPETEKYILRMVKLSWQNAEHCISPTWRLLQ